MLFTNEKNKSSQRNGNSRTGAGNLQDELGASFNAIKQKVLHTHTHTMGLSQNGPKAKQKGTQWSNWNNMNNKMK